MSGAANKPWLDRLTGLVNRNGPAPVSVPTPSPGATPSTTPIATATPSATTPKPAPEPAIVAGLDRREWKRMRPVAGARLLQKLIDRGATHQEIAVQLDISLVGVYRSLWLLKLTDDLARAVDSGAVKTASAYEISKLPHDRQREMLERILRENLDHESVAAIVAKNRKRNAQAKATRPWDGPIRVLGGDAVITVKTSPKRPKADILAALREAIERVQAFKE